jgi:hypothetical protein
MDLLERTATWERPTSAGIDVDGRQEGGTGMKETSQISMKEKEK